MAKQTIKKTATKTTKKVAIGTKAKNGRCPTCGKFTKKK